MVGKSRTVSVAVVVGALLSGGQAMARDFCPDRPGKDTPACVLDPGRLELELGLADSTHDKQAGVVTDTLSLTDLELRFGLTSTLEAQLAWSPYVRSVTKSAAGSDRVSGSDDLTLALRQSLRNPDGSGLSIALQPFVTLPTGHRGIGAGAWQGGVIAPITYEVSDAVGVGLSPEIDLVADQDGHGAHLAWTVVAAASRQVGPVSLGADLWFSRDEDPDAPSTQASLDLAAAWEPTGLKDLQFDLGVNTGLNRATPDYEVYAGLARRF